VKNSKQEQGRDGECGQLARLEPHHGADTGHLALAHTNLNLADTTSRTSLNPSTRQAAQKEGHKQGKAHSTTMSDTSMPLFMPAMNTHRVGPMDVQGSEWSSSKRYCAQDTIPNSSIFSLQQ